ncbi:MAG: hypothetical protein R2818_03540 [Flavobacteriales bacterium]
MLEQLKHEKSTCATSATTPWPWAWRGIRIRPGRVLATAEMHDLDRSPLLLPAACPTTQLAGKPTPITFGLDELNQRFER